MHTQVGIILGSRTEWRTMQYTVKLLVQLGISYEERIVTANRNSNRLQEYASQAIDRGLEIIIAGSGNTPHLPEILASKTEIPVLSVPIKTNAAKSRSRDDLGSHDNTGNPAGKLATGPDAAINAALLAASILGNKYPEIRENLVDYRLRQNPTSAFAIRLIITFPVLK